MVYMNRLIRLAVVTLGFLSVPFSNLHAKFVVVAPRVEQAALKADARALHASGILQSLTAELNELFVIPERIEILFAECGEANAFFSSDDAEITICIELIEDMQDSLSESYPDQAERDAIVEGALTGTLLHEVGHALVSVLELPITGREEDAVDQLSTWILIEAEMPDSVLSGAEIYYLAEDSQDDETYAGEHSLNRQRYFNMVCWVYGSDSENNQHLLDEWKLPEARAEQCESEYELMRNSWATLLGDHIRD